MAATAQFQKPESAAEVIELSSDSESEGPEVEDEEAQPSPTSPDVDDQPLLRAAGIRYRTDPADEDEAPQDGEPSPSSAKLALRSKATGSAKHRHVSIEIPLPTSSELRRRKAEAEAAESRKRSEEEEVFRTPSERKHITFDESDHDEFVTPREAPPSNEPESSIPQRDTNAAGMDEEGEEESDADAPPEAVSTRAAAVESMKVAEAVAKAAEQQAAALKRKRKERDAFFKQQAEERKRAEKQARPEEAAYGASTPNQAPEPELAEKQMERRAPTLLPLELLESDDEESASSLQPNSAVNGTHKRRKLGGADPTLLREPKLPKDKRLGSTAYRVVAGTGDARLAPKMKKQSVSLKETLLRRNRVAQPRGGFFVKNR